MENKKNSFIIRGNNIIGAPSVGYTELTYDQYLQMKDNDEIDLNKQYLVTCDEQTGTLLSADDIAYNDETVKSKIDELDNTKLDKGYKSATDANDAIGEHGINVFILSYTSANIPVRRTGIIRSFSYVQDNYIRVNQEFSTIDNSPQNGGTYKRYGSSDDGGVTYTWSGWNFVGSIDDSTTALLKTWSSSKIASELKTSSNTGVIDIVGTNYINTSSMVNRYQVVNGICYVTIEFQALQTKSLWDGVSSFFGMALPKPKVQIDIFYDGTQRLLLGNSGLVYGDITVDKRVYASFSYPIAE